MELVQSSPSIFICWDRLGINLLCLGYLRVASQIPASDRHVDLQGPRSISCLRASAKATPIGRAGAATHNISEACERGQRIDNHRISHRFGHRLEVYLERAIGMKGDRDELATLLDMEWTWQGSVSPNPRRPTDVPKGGMMASVRRNTKRPP